jgi:2-polyprenyl-3-methyl-5-hydroxy-6-metoxy-1,4-benzoquinol methylase
MDKKQTRDCPICGYNKSLNTFPYITNFNNINFYYLKCGRCFSVFVNQIPNKETFALMYAKDVYHDCDYDAEIGGTYQESVQLLQSYAHSGTTVLDYGCGLGAFLKELSANDFIPFGVEFDVDAADFASKNSSCEVWTVDDFYSLSTNKRFDIIHLGDVLEHLPEPTNTINEILEKLKPGGILFVEGPLEINPSPVYWSIMIFGWIKRILRPRFVANDPPHHLFRVDAPQQLAFFSNYIGTDLNLEYWRVYETGWPYAGGSIIKRIISSIAILIGGKCLFGAEFGNRFQAIFTKK